MPASSVSDFERFSHKIGSSTDARAEAMIDGAKQYAEMKRAAAAAEAQRWLSDARRDEADQLRRHETEARRMIEEAGREAWATFLLQRQLEVETGLESALSEAFPELAACFIRKIETTYPDGTFSLPDPYAPLVDRARFDVKTEAKTRIVFTRGQLYIEFSAARLLEEFADAIAEAVGGEASSWPA